MKGQDIHVQDTVWKMHVKSVNNIFENAEILGWFLTVPGQPLEANHNIKKIHEKFSPERKAFLS